MRKAREDAPPTDLEAEGLPGLEGQPPGIDDQSAVEGMMPPRDHPVAATDYGTTTAEQHRPEPLDRRVRREQPDRVRAEQEPAGRLVAPDAGNLMDDEAAEVAELVAEDDTGMSAEEAAVHIERDR